MSEPKSKQSLTRTNDRIELTQTIKKLSMPVAAPDEALEGQVGTALLLCRDSASRKWGPRWLSQSGLQVAVPADPANGLEIARTTTPDIILVEAGLLDPGSRPMFETLLDAADLKAAVFVLCSNNRDISRALQAGAFDIARKPFEWQVIGNRAAYALRFRTKQAQLETSNASLKKALALADAAREMLRSQESVEPVTGLPNKSKFVDLLRRGMRAIDRDKNALSVFVIGFTRFRLVIEAMGQEQADLILTQIGRNLADCLRSAVNVDVANSGLRTAAVASLDQFRFGLMLTCSGEEGELGAFQQQLLDVLSQPIQISGQTVHLSACLGVALYPHDADDVDSLLQRADNAMRDAQSRGGGFKYYCSETDAAAARKLRIEHMLHEALDQNELSLAYQPINDVASGKVFAAEALLRWRQADGSYIGPEEFVAVAEESGLMIRTGEFALNAACEQLAAWRAAGVALSTMCVNVAKVQLMSSGFSQTVRRILEKYSLEPGDLELEISERGVLSGDYDVITQLHELKHLGVKLSVDDFGTGDSAIAYLKQLPVDTLKIDRSYIAGLTDDGKDAAIASAMVALGQRLDLTVIAEGVETEAQLQILRELGCDAFQGFLVSKPVSADTFAARALKIPKST